MNFLTDVLSVLFPEYCPECGRLLTVNEPLCFLCLEELAPANLHYEPSRNPLMLRFADAPVAGCAACFYYAPKGFLQNAVQTMKYRDRPKIGLALGEYYGAQLRHAKLIEHAALVPVPMHPKKKRKRGYNQAEWIARGLSNATGAPFKPGLLRKTKHTISQTKLSREQRQKNVRDVFLAAAKVPRKVVLVDDVITTGSTMAAAARALHSAGAKEIFALSIAAASAG